jgi:hypothetical protein
MIGALAVAPASAAPQYSGTNDAAGAAGDHTVDCSDFQNRYMPFCQSINQGAGKPAQVTTGARRTNSLRCPAGDLVAAGTEKNGNRLYRCDAAPAPKAHSPAMTFTPGY